MKIEDTDLKSLQNGEYDLGIDAYEIDPEFISLFEMEVPK